MITMYRAYLDSGKPAIKKVEVVREDSGAVYFRAPSGAIYHHPATSAGTQSGYFHSYRQAKEFAIKCAQDRVSTCMRLEIKAAAATRDAFDAMVDVHFLREHEPNGD